MSYATSQAQTSQAKTDANRQNARDEAALFSEPKTQTRCCGPKSSEGKAKSSLNAVKTGLTGRTVLLPSDDVAAYESHVQRFMKDLEPVGPREYELVQALADNSWRCERIFSLEMAIFAKGRTQFAAQFEHEDAAARPGLIELETYLHYEKQLRNLHIQEGRLRRQREKDLAELEKLQKERAQTEKRELEIAAKLYLAARKDNKPFDPAQFGFVFSTTEIERYLDNLTTPNFARQTAKSDLRAA